MYFYKSESYQLLITFVLFISSFLGKISTDKLSCLKTVDTSKYPKCEIIDHLKPGPFGKPVSSYECLSKWENTIYLGKDSNITLNCWAPFPIDMDYDGVKPIKNFKMDFYKRIDGLDPSDWSAKVENPDPSMNYGIHVDISAKSLEYSGNYIFHPLGKPEDKVIIYVFAEKKDLPLFLDTREGKQVLDAYVDPEENAIVIPCRSSNYNASKLLLFYDFGEITDQIDGENLRYDPRRGFIRKIPEEDSEIDIYGEYECQAEMKTSGRDRMKVRAKAPPSIKVSGEDEDDTEDTEDDDTPTKTEPQPIVLTYLPGIITFQSISEEYRFKSKCTLPAGIGAGHTPFFANAHMDNPTASRFNIKCSHLDSNCGEHVRILGHITSPNILEINRIHYSGLVQCAVTTNLEIKEYFTGSDGKIYFDWNEAAARNALVKVKPTKVYERYTDVGEFSFTCIHSGYISANTIWWTLTHKDGSVLDYFVSGFEKSFSLNLDIIEISCGVSLWNATKWYKDSMSIEVVDFILPVLREQNRTVTFKTNEVNQGLSCEVEPGPHTKLEWFRDGKKIDDIPQVDLGDSLVLFFKEINKTFEGNYTCRASTKSGSIDAEFEVILEEGKVLETEVLGRKANCSPIGEAILYHNGTNQEVVSLSSIMEDEILVLKFSHENCLNPPDPSLEEIQIFVKLFQEKEDVEESTSVSPEIEIEIVTEIVPEIVSEQPPLVEEEVVVEQSILESTVKPPEDLIVSGGENESVKSDTMGQLRSSRLYHYLLPILIGISVILVVIIIAYATYSYFVMPWKVRRISTVSQGPFI